MDGRYESLNPSPLGSPALTPTVTYWLTLPINDKYDLPAHVPGSAFLQCLGRLFKRKGALEPHGELRSVDHPRELLEPPGVGLRTEGEPAVPAGGAAQGGGALAADLDRYARSLEWPRR